MFQLFWIWKIIPNKSAITFILSLESEMANLGNRFSCVLDNSTYSICTYREGTLNIQPLALDPLILLLSLTVVGSAGQVQWFRVFCPFG